MSTWSDKLFKLTLARWLCSRALVSNNVHMFITVSQRVNWPTVPSLRVVLATKKEATYHERVVHHGFIILPPARTGGPSADLLPVSHNNTKCSKTWCWQTGDLFRNTNNTGRQWKIISGLWVSNPSDLPLSGYGDDHGVEVKKIIVFQVSWSVWKVFWNTVTPVLIGRNEFTSLVRDGGREVWKPSSSHLSGGEGWGSWLIHDRILKFRFFFKLLIKVTKTITITRP